MNTCTTDFPHYKPPETMSRRLLKSCIISESLYALVDKYQARSENL